MAITISLLALVATLYQLHLQRLHNEKSLKPLPQIVLIDKEKLEVHIQNSGVGPLIVSNVSYNQADTTYTGISRCLSLAPQAFQHLEISKSSQKVIMAGASLEIFSTEFEKSDTSEFQDKIRRELALIEVTVEGEDIYKNKVTVKRSLQWFLRHDSIIIQGHVL